MVFDDDIDDYIFSYNKSLKPEKDVRGLDTDIVVVNNMSWRKRDSLRKAYINTLNEVFTVKIDSLYFNSEFVLSKRNKNQKGFESYIGIKNLSEGKHILSVIRKRIKKNDTQTVRYATIPFWYYPD
ncbi:hypothetical protein [Winogradskyella algicola]|uniref:hypothetical protein n=1 Tax=Winogradskyella algicola TaxID=2575815 RepID=UPI0011093C69|nr:hypothetical protein [Winogradskyella algicola]